MPVQSVCIWFTTMRSTRFTSLGTFWVTWRDMSEDPDIGDARIPILPIGDASSAPRELKRRLSQRQLSMSAIGGAVGVGLFLGDTVTLRLPGAGLRVPYLLSGSVSFILAYSVPLVCSCPPGPRSP